MLGIDSSDNLPDQLHILGHDCDTLGMNCRQVPKVQRNHKYVRQLKKHCQDLLRNLLERGQGFARHTIGTKEAAATLFINILTNETGEGSKRDEFGC